MYCFCFYFTFFLLFNNAKSNFVESNFKTKTNEKFI